MSDDELRSIVQRVNDAWRSERFDEMREYFHPNVVLAQPGFGQRVEGRDALMASYQDFARQAKVISFTCGDVHVDRAGDSAVTTMHWRMEYEFGGARYDESGWDLLVFGRHGGRWVVVWRTVVVEQ